MRFANIPVWHKEGVYFESVMHSHSSRFSKRQSVEMAASVKSNYTSWPFTFSLTLHIEALLQKLLFSSCHGFKSQFNHFPRFFRRRWIAGMNAPPFRLIFGSVSVCQMHENPQAKVICYLSSLEVSQTTELYQGWKRCLRETGSSYVGWWPV